MVCKILNQGMAWPYTKQQKYWGQSIDRQGFRLLVFHSATPYLCCRRRWDRNLHALNACGVRHQPPHFCIHFIQFRIPVIFYAFLAFNQRNACIKSNWNETKCISLYFETPEMLYRCSSTELCCYITLGSEPFFGFCSMCISMYA